MSGLNLSPSDAEHRPQAEPPSDAQLIEQLIRLRRELLETEWRARQRLRSIPADRRQSARNLIHYVALRRRDIRDLQETLVPRGLSSLGRCEAYVMANVDAVLRRLGASLDSESPGRDATASVAGGSPEPDITATPAAQPPPLQYADARQVLRQRTRELLGASGDRPAIMVTMPAEAAEDGALVHDLVAAGMTVMRVNCAHDDAAAWARMIDNLRRAETELGLRCRVAMDLGGPKIRTVLFDQRKVVLSKDDRVILVGANSIDQADRSRASRRHAAAATIGCSLPEAVRGGRVGDRVLFDDGKVAGTVEERGDDFLAVRITRAKKKGQKLRGDKGINFPDARFDLPALTEKDIGDLEFVARHADIVNYSFVRQVRDIDVLHEHLERLGKPDLAIILKIENVQSFENLPLLLLESLRYTRSVGVMIARGDLAVECGWERLVEVQEEILWMCEAAHVPVVWATQVLEGLAKKGLPTRAEITDAGAGARAECVMLNKGPHIVETVESLHDILIRMQEHQAKKRPMFRRLNVADRLAAE